MKPLRSATLISALFVLTGIGCLIVGAILCFNTRAFLATAKTVPGRVMRLDPDTDNHHNPTYHTVFSFNDDSGNAHTIRTSYSQRPRPYDVGDRITILYPPDAPESARIRSFTSLWLAPMILGIIGFVFPTIGVFAFIAAHKTYGTA